MLPTSDNQKIVCALAAAVRAQPLSAPPGRRLRNIPSPLVPVLARPPLERPLFLHFFCFLSAFWKSRILGRIKGPWNDAAFFRMVVVPDEGIKEGVPPINRQSDPVYKADFSTFTFSLTITTPGFVLTHFPHPKGGALRSAPCDSHFFVTSSCFRLPKSSPFRPLLQLIANPPFPQNLSPSDCHLHSLNI